MQYIGIVLITLVYSLITNKLPISANLLSTLFISPLLCGVYTFAYYQAKGEVPLFMDFFSGFSRKVYLPLMATVILSFLPCVLLSVGFAYLFLWDDFLALMQFWSMSYEEVMQSSYDYGARRAHIGNLPLFFSVAVPFFIIISVLSSYIQAHIIIRREGLGKAFKFTLSTFRSFPLKLLGFMLMSILLIALGGLLCGIGLLVSYPVVQIAIVNSFIDLEQKSNL